MSPDRTWAVAHRVLRQLRRDPRSIVMILGAPVLLLWLLKATFQEVPGVFERVGPMLLGTFPFVMMFLVTSITMLRERNQGTLDRMMVSPIGRGDIMVGYAVAFLVLAACQATVALTFAVQVFDMPLRGSVWQALVIVFALAVFGVALGLALSAFAHTEFQAVQFMPIVVLPQIFLAGMLAPVSRMAQVLEWASTVVPLRYSFGALNGVMVGGQTLWSADLWRDTLITLLVPCVLLALGALTMRRSSTA
jgi:ABC-2 type transport system permease protein